MKNFFSILVFISLITPSLVAQVPSLEKGNWQFTYGGGFYIGKSFSSIDFKKQLNSNNETDGLKQGCLSFHYNTHHNFSLGLNLLNEKGSDITSTSSTFFTFKTLGVSIQYYFLNRPKLNVYFGITANHMNAEIASKEIDPQTQTETRAKIVSDRGHYNDFSFGLNKYFGHRFGVYAKLGYAFQGVSFTSFSIDGIKQDKIGNINVEDFKINSNGLSFMIGISLKTFKKNKTIVSPA